jgi:hypothetical protein
LEEARGFRANEHEEDATAAVDFGGMEVLKSSNDLHHCRWRRNLVQHSCICPDQLQASRPN